MGSHPLLLGPAVPSPQSLRSELTKPLLQGGEPLGAAVLYVCIRKGAPLVCCVRESDGRNAGIFNLPSGPCNPSLDKTLQDALQRVFFLDMGRHMDRRISIEQLATAPVTLVGKVFVALVVESEQPVLRRAWNERAASDEESETDELELIHAKAFKCWEGGFRSLWVAEDASGSSRQVSVSPLVAAAVRKFQIDGLLEKAPICQYGNGCRFGVECRNLHPCKWFQQGHCQNGRQCNYAHVK